jgi:hypothetical protein
VLAGKLGSQGMTKDDIYGPAGPDDKKSIEVSAISASGHSMDWVEHESDYALSFKTVGQSRTTTLVPLYQLFDERYTVYWKVNPKSA